MAIAGGIDWTAIMKAIAKWVAAATGLPTSKILWSQNKAPRPPADAITMRVMSIETMGDSWTDTIDNPLVFDDLTVSTVNTTANTVTVALHQLSTGDGPVQVASTGTLPGGLAVDTDYWVVAPDANTLMFSTTFAGTGGADIDGAPSGNPVTTVDITSAGTGTITISSTEDTVRAGEEILYAARGFARLIVDLECHTTDSVNMNMAVATLNRVLGRWVLPSMIAILDEVNVGLVDTGKVRAVRGHLDALLFEPRAMLELTFETVSEDVEPGTIIQTADVTPTYDDVDQATTRVRVGPR